MKLYARFPLLTPYCEHNYFGVFGGPSKNNVCWLEWLYFPFYFSEQPLKLCKSSTVEFLWASNVLCSFLARLALFSSPTSRKKYGRFPLLNSYCKTGCFGSFLGPSEKFRFPDQNGFICLSPSPNNKKKYAISAELLLQK